MTSQPTIPWPNLTILSNHDKKSSRCSDSLTPLLTPQFYTFPPTDSGTYVPNSFPPLPSFEKVAPAFEPPLKSRGCNIYNWSFLSDLVPWSLLSPTRHPAPFLCTMDSLIFAAPINRAQTFASLRLTILQFLRFPFPPWFNLLYTSSNTLQTPASLNLVPQQRSPQQKYYFGCLPPIFILHPLHCAHHRLSFSAAIIYSVPPLGFFYGLWAPRLEHPYPKFFIISRTPDFLINSEYRIS